MQIIIRSSIILLSVMTFGILITSNSAFGQTAYNLLHPNEIDIIEGSGGTQHPACVLLVNNCFYPNPLNVAVGTTVTWKNTDFYNHSVTSGKSTDDNAGSIFDSGIINSGKTFQFTFTNAGTYDYFDTVYPLFKGQVIVSSTSIIPSISIRSDLPSYKFGDTIVITGHIRDVQNATAITMRIFNPSQLLMSIAQFVPSSDGSFSKTIDTSQVVWLDSGTYTIFAQYGLTTSANATFHFISQSPTHTTLTSPASSPTTSPSTTTPSVTPTTATTIPTTNSTTPPIPHWVKSLFGLYGQGQVSDSDLISALQFLIKVGVIKVS